MAHRVLFVCAMNVCRSPLMAFTFADALLADADGAEWSVIARGTNVTRRDPMCEVSASLISSSAAGASFAESHASAPIAVTQLGSQDAIFVATRAERSRVAQLNPSVRSRTFTVREAVLLGERAVASGEIDAVLRNRPPNQRLRLGGYPALLNSRRGSVHLPAPRKGLPFFGGPPSDPLDIRDVHLEGGRTHLNTLKELQGDVRLLRGQISDFLKARVASV
ncbi:hypothetical protein [Microbacterium sp.]|uniref:arsenate reductase/protein-tyrosine-phosphatase family protein n=1 Tax=Microbacterium sp. TaxID=51671 RepID=UPI003F70B8D1